MAQFVILKTVDGSDFSALVKSKKYGDSGTFYTKNLDDLSKISTFDSKEKAETAIRMIEKRRSHDYSFKVVNINDAISYVSKGGWCLVYVNLDRSIEYLKLNDSFDKSEEDIKFFVNEEMANDYLNKSNFKDKDRIMVVIFDTL